MKNTEYTCDSCGSVEPKETAGDWGHYVRGTGDKKVQADFCSQACHRAWSAENEHA